MHGPACIFWANLTRFLVKVACQASRAYHQKSVQTNASEPLAAGRLMSHLYGEKWDPPLEPEDQMKGASSGGKFVKLVRFGMFVKAVFIVPISSAIIESLFSRCATCSSHSSRLIIEVLMRSAQVRLYSRQDAREHGGRHNGQRHADIGAGGRHRRRSPPHPFAQVYTLLWYKKPPCKNHAYHQFLYIYRFPMVH